MSDEVSAAPPATGGCPITDEFLPQNMRKHVDPAAPVPLRMMAAKGLVPLAPSDLVGALFLLTFDPEASIREVAHKSAAGLPDRILSSALRDEGVKPPVLGWLLGLFGAQEPYAEMLILNALTPDEAVASLAATCSHKTAEIIGQNQLRLLRFDGILRGLAQNPNAEGALLDGVCDFAVRNGVLMADLPQMRAARVRLFGPEAAAAPPEDPGPTAEELMRDFEAAEEAARSGGAGASGGAAAESAAGGADGGAASDGKRLTLSQRLMKMSVSEKIKLATKGNKEARSALFRDSNKLVLVATIRSPRITDGEVLTQASNKAANDEVLRVIFNNREWLRQYPIRLALVRNPKVPQAISMRLMNQLHEADVKNLARDKNVPGSIQALAKKATEKKTDKKGGH